MFISSERQSYLRTTMERNNRSRRPELFGALATFSTSLKAIASKGIKMRFKRVFRHFDSYFMDFEALSCTVFHKTFERKLIFCTGICHQWEPF